MPSSNHWRGKDNWKYFRVQFRLWLAEWFLYTAVRLAPDCDEGNDMIQLIRDYIMVNCPLTAKRTMANKYRVQSGRWKWTPNDD